MTFWGSRLTDLKDVLLLFVIPFGGGIPAGVILAKDRGVIWPLTTFLYVISDLLLACAFEPLLLLFIHLAKSSPFLTRWAVAYKESLAKTGFKYGLAPSPLSLILLSFGVDPMTGRAAARAAGHGFISGWTLAICGDLIFFGLIMVSTLALNSLLGDGTAAAIIVMIAMLVAPALIKRVKEGLARNSQKS